MATQLQPTPVLYGKDAEEVLKEISRKPSPEEKKEIYKKYSEMFKNIKREGF